MDDPSSKDISSNSASPKNDFARDPPWRGASSKDDPSQGQFLRSRGRPLSPLHRVIVYDSDEDTLEVTSRVDGIRGKRPQSFSISRLF